MLHWSDVYKSMSNAYLLMLLSYLLVSTTVVLFFIFKTFLQPETEVKLFYSLLFFAHDLVFLVCSWTVLIRSDLCDLRFDKIFVRICHLGKDTNADHKRNAF